VQQWNGSAWVDVATRHDDQDVRAAAVKIGFP
jgi:hypothetical protein